MNESYSTLYNYQALSRNCIRLHLIAALQDYILGRAVRSAARNQIYERRTKTATGARALVWLPVKSGTN